MINYAANLAPLNTLAVAHTAEQAPVQEATHYYFPVNAPTTDGKHKRTSVSIPRHLVHAWVEVCGSRNAFRQRLNEAALAVKPRPGFGRSQLIRAYLEAKLDMRAEEQSSRSSIETTTNPTGESHMDKTSEQGAQAALPCKA